MKTWEKIEIAKLVQQYELVDWLPSVVAQTVVLVPVCILGLAVDA